MGQPFEEKFTPSPDSCFKYKIGKEENREMVEVRCCFFISLKLYLEDFVLLDMIIQNFEI